MVEREVKVQEQGFDQAELNFEHRLLQSEIVSSTQVTLREVLKREGADPVGLLHMPFNFQARDMGDSVLYIASFSENQASFGGKRFIKVLRGAKPVRAGMVGKSQDNDGIVGDWQMLKEDVRIQKSYLPGYNSLYRKHTTPTSPITRKLGEHFREIGENHFSRFWNAIYVYSEDSVSGHLEYTFQVLRSGEKELDKLTFDSVVFAHHHNIFPETIMQTKGLL